MRRAARALAVAVFVLWSGTALAKDVTIEFWFGESPEGYNQAMQAIVGAFNRENPGIAVNMVRLGHPDEPFQEKLRAAIAGGLSPDVVYMDGVTIQEWGLASNAFIPISELMPRADLSALDYLPGPVRNFTIDATWYGLPFRTDARGLYLNQDMFEEAGLDPRTGPVDLFELDEYAAKLTRYDRNGTLLRLGFAPLGNNDADGLLWFWAFGGDYFNYEQLAPTFTGVPSHRAALEWIQSYADRYGPSARSSNANFYQGKIAMHVNSTTRLQEYPEKNPRLRWWVSKIPRSAGAAETNYSGVLGVAIPRGARHSAEALKFVLYLARPETQVFWYRNTRSFPARFSAVKTILNGITDPRERVMVESLPFSRVSAPFYNQVREIFKKNVQRMIKKEIIPQQVLEDTQRAVEPIYRDAFRK